MSKKSQISDSFWTDEWVDNLDPSEKLVFIYLLTNANRNLIGTYKVSLKRMAFETGFEKDMVEKIITRFVDDGKIQRINSYIIIVNGLKYQTPNPNMVKAMQKEVDMLPTEVRNALGMVYKGFYILSYSILFNNIQSAEPNADEETEDKEMNKQVQGIIGKRKELRWSTPFGGAKKEPQIATHLLGHDNYKNIIQNMTAYEKRRGEKFLPRVSSLDDFYKHYPVLKVELDGGGYVGGL